jgi:hypothetical protein
MPITYDQRFIYSAVKKLGPDGPAQLLERCVRIGGRIDAERFERAADDLVRRHPILRARLDVAGGQPVQRLAKPEGSFEVVMLPDGTEESADTLLSARRDHGFDLYQENPLRITLAQAGGDVAFLLLVAHHMFVDETALDILLDEYLRLSLAPPAVSEHQPSSAGYLEHALREQEMVRDGTFESRARYWTSYLGQAQPDLRLPGRSADPVTQSVDRIPVMLTREAFAALSERARRLRVTPFALVTSAIFRAVRDITDQDRLLLGVITNTRRRPFDRTVGQFANVYAIDQDLRRTDMSDTAIKALGHDMMNALSRYVPFDYFSGRLPWLRDRLTNVLTVSDVNVDFIPARAGSRTLRAGAGYSGTDAAPAGRPGSALGGGPEYSITPFPLTERAWSADVPYHGVVLSFIFWPENGALSGWLGYESSLVSGQAAQTVTALLTDALSDDEP